MGIFGAYGCRVQDLGRRVVSATIMATVPCIMPIFACLVVVPNEKYMWLMKA